MEWSRLRRDCISLINIDFASATVHKLRPKTVPAIRTIGAVKLFPNEEVEVKAKSS
jgi:hypothetical protein